MITSPVKLSTGLFTYHAATNTFSAEASDLPRLRGDYAGSPVIALVSQRTGREIIFAMTREQRDDEGDLMWIDFRPVDAANWAAGTVRIFND